MTDFDLLGVINGTIIEINSTIMHYRLATDNPYLEAFLVLLLLACFGWLFYVIYLLWSKKYGKKTV